MKGFRLVIAAIAFMVSFSINLCNKNFVFGSEKILGCQKANNNISDFLVEVGLEPEESPEDDCAGFKSGWTEEWK